MCKQIVTYLTAGLAASLLLVAIGATVIFIATSPSCEVAKGIALSMLGGLGSTVGAFIGGLLVLRVKAIREFLQRTIHEHPPAKHFDAKRELHSFLKEHFREKKDQTPPPKTCDGSGCGCGQPKTP